MKPGKKYRRQFYFENGIVPYRVELEALIGEYVIMVRDRRTGLGKPDDGFGPWSKYTHIGIGVFEWLMSLATDESEADLHEVPNDALQASKVRRRPTGRTAVRLPDSRPDSAHGGRRVRVQTCTAMGRECRGGRGA